MRKANKKTVAVMAVVVCLVLTAYVCRFLGNSGFYSQNMGLIRSFIYVSLYVAWGYSVYYRVIQKQVRSFSLPNYLYLQAVQTAHVQLSFVRLRMESGISGSSFFLQAYVSLKAVIPGRNG